MNVVDASVLVDFVLGAGSEASDELLGLFRIGSAVIAPDLVDVEVGQAIRRMELAGHVDWPHSLLMLADLESAPIRRYPMRQLVSRAFDFRHRLTVYDGVYLALAERVEATLLTGDSALASMPEIDVDVRLLATST